MAIRAPLSAKAAAATIATSELAYHVDSWLMDCEIRQHSAKTLANRRLATDKLLWFLRQQELPACGPQDLKAFFLYLSRGHEEEDGRWGGTARQAKEPVKPGTVVTYFNSLRTLFNVIVEEDGMAETPFKNLKPPVDRPDEIETFSEEQFEALCRAARNGPAPKRDLAILHLFLDTGLRAEEVCGVRACDLDLQERSVRVEGKGAKKRTVHYGQRTRKILWGFLRATPRDGEAYLFVGVGGHKPGARLLRGGMTQLIHRLGVQAGVKQIRCSPHTFRHTFAISFLRRGGNQFELMRILGHTDLTQTSRYVRLAQSDVKAAQTRCSPVDGLGR